MRVEHNGWRERHTQRQREILTVSFMCLVENFFLKVLLILHGWVKVSVIVLQRTNEKQLGLCVHDLKYV